jgi:cell fate (sporulation/competence/biofilm development) regulator YmcA (YheA/YmcA/DUF963 family)
MPGPLDDYKKKADSFEKVIRKFELITAKMAAERKIMEKGGVAGAKAVEEVQKLGADLEKARQEKNKAHDAMNRALEKL